MKETPKKRLSHAKYEYQMACYCIEQLHLRQTQLQWNALLAAFAVYFRNLEKHFLKGGGDQETIKAKHYIKRFKTTSAEDLEDELNELHSQILHLSGKRTTENERKLGLKKAAKLMRWLAENIAKFESELPEPYKSRWKDIGPEGSIDVPTQHTTSNQVIEVRSNNLSYIQNTSEGKGNES